eukprot:9822313-Alexandrium_andersonii.AAC.1
MAGRPRLRVLPPDVDLDLVPDIPGAANACSRLQRFATVCCSANPGRYRPQAPLKSASGARRRRISG